MEITNIELKKIESSGNMKAVSSVTFDNEFVVHDIKIIENNGELFIAMPNRRMKNGTFKDIAHPISSEVRNRIQKVLLEKYNSET